MTKKDVLAAGRRVLVASMVTLGLFTSAIVPAGAAAADEAGAAVGAASTDLPAAIRVDPFHNVFLFSRHARGFQLYSCSALKGTYEWTLLTPVALLTAPAATGPDIFHSKGPSWTSLADGSEVVGHAVATAAAPTGRSIPWLKVAATSHRGAGVLSQISFIQRVNTRQGTAPATGCDTGHRQALIAEPYTATYNFWAPRKTGAEHSRVSTS